MIDLIPSCLIKKDSINDWNSYSKNIDKFPYVKKYLEPLLIRCIENTNNPLAIGWVVSLLRGTLDGLEKTLRKLEDDLGEDNLRGVFRELEKSKASDADQINVKIDSLWGEISVFNSLKKRYSLVEKLDEIGDWLCDGSTILSVKTKLDLDLNYELIENSIKSLYFLEENDDMIRYNTISLMRPIHIDHAFREKIIWFIENHLSDSIIRSDKLMYSISSIQEELQKFYVDKKERRSILTVKSTSGILSGVRQIKFTLL